MTIESRPADIRYTRAVAMNTHAYTPDAHQLSAIRDVIGDARRRIEAILAARHARARAEDGGTPHVR